MSIAAILLLPPLGRDERALAPAAFAGVYPEPVREAYRRLRRGLVRLAALFGAAWLWLGLGHGDIKATRHAPAQCKARFGGV